MRRWPGCCWVEDAATWCKPLSPTGSLAVLCWAADAAAAAVRALAASAWPGWRKPGWPCWLLSLAPLAVIEACWLALPLAAASAALLGATAAANTVGAPAAAAADGGAAPAACEIIGAAAAGLGTTLGSNRCTSWEGRAPGTGPEGGGWTAGGLDACCCS